MADAYISGPAAPVEQEQGSPVAAPERAVVVRSLVRLAVVLVVTGVAVGVLWRLLLPVATSWSDGVESVLAPEVTMAVLGLVTGTIVAVQGLVRPGAWPTIRLLVAVLGSILGSGLAWGVGRLLGAPVLEAVGTVAIWPLTVAVVTMVATLVASLRYPAGNDD